MTQKLVNSCQRIIKGTNGKKTIYHYDQVGNIISEETIGSQIVRDYIYIGHSRIAMVLSKRCLPDLDKDNDVDGNELAILASDFNRNDCSSTSPCQGDINGDGLVDSEDLSILATELGRTDCPHDEYYYFHNDHLGTPQRITDQSGTIVWSAKYRPFGEASITTDTTTNPFRFPGQYLDPETGLHYNYFRYHEPGIGRYLAINLLSLAKTTSYGFCNNNPVIYVDFKGDVVTTIAENIVLTQEMAHFASTTSLSPLGMAIAIVLFTPTETAGPEIDMLAPPYDPSKLVATIEVPVGPKEHPDLSYTPESCRLRFEACSRAAKIKYPSHTGKRTWEVVKCWIGFIMCLVSNL